MRTLRFAVVGLGHFAQSAGLPALDRLRGVKIAALVSGSPEKRRALGERYDVSRTCDYDEYDRLLASGEIDAVYIATPPDRHADLAIRAAHHGVHVLCEKPMAATEADCARMIEAAADARVKLMIGYRLHFQPGNLHVIELIRRGAIGEPRLFSSTFAFALQDAQNIRAQPRPGAGPLFDIGVYCINAARYVFQSEPTAVAAMRIDDPADERFRFIEEGVAATLRFPHRRSASFQISFGTESRSRYEVVGTAGVIEVDDAYDYATGMSVTLVKDGKRRRRSFRKLDQIAAEMHYFATCVRDDLEPEPGGLEGLADVRIVEAIHAAARSGHTVAVEPVEKRQRPDAAQCIERRAHGEPPLVDVESAS